MEDTRVQKILDSIRPEDRAKVMETFARVAATLQVDAGTRGIVLIVMIETEAAVDQVILNHFCAAEEQPLFTYLFLHGMPFSRKIKILDDTLKREYPEIYKKSRKLISKLEKAATLRNKLAHSMPHYEEYGQHPTNEEIPLRTYEKGELVRFVVSTKFVDDQVIEMSKVQLQLSEMLDVVKATKRRP